METGRDGCRVPIPWEAEAPGFGFSPAGATWLPQPEGFRAYAVDRQEGVPGSTLELYRHLLRLRREHGLGQGDLVWEASPPSVLALRNGAVRVVINLGKTPVPLPEGRLLAASLLPEGEVGLPGNAAVWLAAG